MSDVYRVDCGLFENPAKALVVRRSFEKATSSETIENFVALMIQLKELHPQPDAVLEIETRPGVFKSKKDDNGVKRFGSDMLINSKREHLILGMNIDVNPHQLRSLKLATPQCLDMIDRLKQNVTCPVVDSEFKDISSDFKFEPGVPKEFFFSRLEYFLKIAKSGSSKLRESKCAFTVDLGYKNRGVPRQTIDLSQRRFYTTEKKYKSTIDLLHNCVQYRLAGAIELNHEVSREAVKSNIFNSNMIRVKVRRVFVLFDTIEVAFTRVFQLDSEFESLKSLIKVSLESDDRFDTERLQADLLATLADSKTAKVIHEFEMEYLNTQELINNYKALFTPDHKDHPLAIKTYFLSKIRSLLYNSVCLYWGFEFNNLVSDELHARDYWKQFWNNPTDPKGFTPVRPVIGTYLDRMIYEAYLRGDFKVPAQAAGNSQAVQPSRRLRFETGVVAEAGSADGKTNGHQQQTQALPKVAGGSTIDDPRGLGKRAPK